MEILINGKYHEKFLFIINGDSLNGNKFLIDVIWRDFN